MLRHSKYRTEILTFERGKFSYTATDTLVKLPLFKAEGKPSEWHPQKPKEEPIKLSVLGKALNWLSRGKYEKELREAKKQAITEKPISETRENMENDADDRDTEDFEKEIFGEDDT